jgi:hypothetical protein
MSQKYDDTGDEVTEPGRVYMVRNFEPQFLIFKLIVSQSYSRVQCHIAFGELAQHLPPGHLESAIPVLLDMLRDIPFIDFDPSLSWSGAYIRPESYGDTSETCFIEWALSDQLVYSTVTALLRLADRSPVDRSKIIAAVLKLASEIVSQVQEQPCMFIVVLLVYHHPHVMLQW